MKIIDDFLDKESFKKIEKLFTSDNFPWFYNDKVNIFKNHLCLKNRCFVQKLILSYCEL